MGETIEYKILWNYQNICRTCLSETNELVSIFVNSKTQNKTYAEMIMACTSLQILETDEVSLKICPICINQIEQLYLFYKKCKEADLVLQFNLKFYRKSQKESHNIKNNIKQLNTVDSVGYQTVSGQIKCDDYEEGVEDTSNGLVTSEFNYPSQPTYILISINDQTNKLTNKDVKCEDFKDGIVDESNESDNGLSGNDFDCASQIDISTKKQIDQDLENEVTLGLNKNEENKIVQCKFCLKSWISELALEKHLKIHLKQRYECDECSFKFSGSPTLKRHKKIHLDGKVYVCNVCNLNFLSTHYLKIHKILHLSKPKICDECGLVVSTGESLSLHKSVHDGSNKPYQCEICGVKFDKRSLARHMYIHKTSKPYICDKCDRGFLHKPEFRRHNMICTGKRVYEGAKLYKCSICSNSYTTKQRLTYHSRAKHQIEPNEVKSSGRYRHSFICKPEFRRPRTLCTDTRLNEEEKLHKCSSCSNSYITKQGLTHHLRTKHPTELQEDDVMEYNCIKCNREFQSKYLFNRHMRSHSFTLQTSCKICKKNFETYGKLQEHRKLKHKSDKTCQCQVCGKFLATPTTLENHMMVHTNARPHKCSFCDKRFNQISHKYSHERLHTGEKPYTCIQCNKSFRHQTTLIEHNRQHTGETPYKCIICNKGFYRTGNLKKHLNSHK